MSDAPETPPALEEAAEHANRLLTGLSDVVLGQPQAIRQLVLGLLADGHVLLEGVPGVAKTLLARALARSLGVASAYAATTAGGGTKSWPAAKRRWPWRGRCRWLVLRGR